MIIGIDPSYSSSGVALATDEGKIIKTWKIEHGGSCYAAITENHNSCQQIVDDIISTFNGTHVDVICEYPAFATRSGSYLAILNGYLANTLRQCEYVDSITWVGPQHCDSFIKNKNHSKSYIVEYCKENKWITKRTSHDECTAIVFVHLLLAIRNNKWKNSYYVWKR